MPTTMDRRGLLATAAAALALARSSAALAGPPADLKTAARDAWLYGLALIEFARIRHNGAFDGVPSKVNGLVHKRELAGPEMHAITTPNNDTLYSVAFLDLSKGPVTLTLPASGDRYLSVQLLDAYTNTFAVVGTRTTGERGGRFVIAGPEGAAPRFAIRSPTPWVWMLARVLVSSPADLPAAHAVQDSLVLAGPPGRAPGVFAERSAPWADYFNAVQALVVENPPPATDQAFFEHISALGLGPAGGFDARRFSLAQAAEIAAGVDDARAFLSGRRGGSQGAAAAPTAPGGATGTYGQDYNRRAGVALFGLGGLPREEAIYLRASTPDGRGFMDGDGAWRLSFPADQQPPVNAFWSLSMYEMTPEGQLYFTPNPLKRYAIGDRTPGLVRNADGSLDIWIGRTDPGEAKRANWLPAPAKGPYVMTFRGYLPKPALLDGRYRLPALQPA